ncbi:MAG: ParB/RepB/Spo0J family partition protein [Verrucomicrobiota bacterium]|nr:ParB/RepB/Spo0J family partition protein [Verrucomicrobiota bacterium]
MASSIKSRLGRGLDGLISGGAKPTEPASAAPASQAHRVSPTTEVHPAKPEPTGRHDAHSDEAHETLLAAKTGEGFLELPIHSIDPSPFQARKTIEPEALAELVESIRSVGLLQPVLVRKVGERYQLLAGERRWRACQALHLKKIPARVTEANDPNAAVMGLIENLQREDLNAIEQAVGFASLMRDFDLTQDSVAERVGKSRPAIANSLRLLQLEAEIQGYVAKNILSVGHAKVLLGLDSTDERVMLSRRVLEKSLSVRELEQVVAGIKQHKAVRNPARVAPNAEETAVRDLERQMASKLNTKVVLRHTPKRGQIIIEYYGNEDMQRILEKLGLD